MIDKETVYRWSRRELVAELIDNEDLTFDEFINECKKDMVKALAERVTDSGLKLHIAQCYIAFIVNRVDIYFDKLKEEPLYNEFLQELVSSPIPLYKLIRICTKVQYSHNKDDMDQYKTTIKETFNDILVDISLFIKLVNDEKYETSDIFVSTVVFSVMHLIAINRKNGVVDNTLSNTLINDMLWIDLPCMIYPIIKRSL